MVVTNLKGLKELSTLFLRTVSERVSKEVSILKVKKRLCDVKQSLGFAEADEVLSTDLQTAWGKNREERKKNSKI